jgi:hypothetical protein
LWFNSKINLRCATGFTGPRCEFVEPPFLGSIPPETGVSQSDSPSRPEQTSEEPQFLGSIPPETGVSQSVSPSRSEPARD